MSVQTQSPLCGCDVTASNHQLLSYEQAFEHIAREVVELEGDESVDLKSARGRTLSTPLVSPLSLPHFDNAAMDGFAVRLCDIGTRGTVSLSAEQRIVAGSTSLNRLAPNTCARILTGAPLPLGADTVIAQEEVLYDNSTVTFSSPRQSGQNVRRQGENLRAGTRLAEKGQRADAATLTMAAAVGLTELSVKRQARVAIVHTGNEIIEPGQNLRHGQIYNSNGPMLRSLVEAAGASVVDTHACVDNHQTTKSLFVKLANSYDLIVTTGGVSVGDEDHVLNAFNEAGGQLGFAGVAIKPGKPVAFGKVGSALFLGLPGNPIASLVTWTLFGKAVLNALAGSRKPDNMHRVICDSHLAHKHGRREFRLAKLGPQSNSGFEKVIVSTQPSSADISQLMHADGMVSLPAGSGGVKPGTPLEFIAFNL